MGIDNRDYYREDSDSRWSLSNTPIVKLLLIINIVIFVLQIMVTKPVEEGLANRGYRISVIQEFGELDVDRTVYKAQVWRLLTHAFMHSRSSLWHLFFNMLCLWYFGRDVELIYGSREFAWFYILAALVAGLAYVALEMITRPF